MEGLALGQLTQPLNFLAPNLFWTSRPTFWLPGLMASIVYTLVLFNEEGQRPDEASRAENRDSSVYGGS